MDVARTQKRVTARETLTENGKFDFRRFPLIGKGTGKMVNRTKIEWCSHTWNPVTGCQRGCPYCYARAIVNCYGTNAYQSGNDLQEYIAGGTLTVIPGKDTRTYTDALFELRKPLTDYTGNPFPFRFRPTFRRYLLDELRKGRTAKDIFVCSMADLFGDWIPTRWIRDVLDACAAVPKNRYLFLTKNPMRYWRLDKMALLPREENFWYGVTVTDDSAVKWYGNGDGGYHMFWSVEPLLGPVTIELIPGPDEDVTYLPEWVIVGAETGNYRPANKVTPKREWVEKIAAFCAEYGIPVFYKDNLRKLYPDLPKSEFPW